MTGGRATVWLVVLLLAAVSLVSCGTDASEADATGSVLVSAAASLTEAFADIAAAFEAEHPRTQVVLNFGGSSLLREQIIGGAPADVFAPADASQMERVSSSVGLTGVPTIFARNRLAVAVPSGNPGNVRGLPDFASGDLLIGLCAEDVPCGALSRIVLANAGIVPEPDTSEPSVRALLTKIAAGELDAGIVYVTDARATDDIEVLAIPESVNVVAEYPIAVLADASDRRAAGAFVDFVLSEPGLAILASYGFLAP